MASQGRYILKLNDRDVIRAFRRVIEKADDYELNVSFRDQFGVLDEDEINSLEELGGYSINSIQLKVPGEQGGWSFQRLRPEHQDSKNATHDKITFDWEGRLGASSRKIVSLISSELDAALRAPLAALSQEQGSSDVSTHGELMLALESVAARVLVDTVAHRQLLEDEYREKEAALIARIESERERELAKVEQEKGRNDIDAMTRKVLLDQRQSALEELQKKLDDRNNTHVRREIRSSLLELTKERLANFAISKETRIQGRKA
jgi:hypothetical protein